MRLNFQARGEGEPLLVLHGLFGSLDNWHSVSVELARHFRVVTADQRNHGASPHAPEMNYPIMAEDIRELAEAEGFTQTHVLGHSMGGKTAMQYALLYPARVRKLIVVDIAPRAYPPWHDKILAALEALNLEGFQTRAQVEAALAPAVPELELRRFLLKSLSREPHSGFRWKIGVAEIRANYPRLSDGLASSQSFNGPTLFIRGERSDYVSKEDLPQIKSLFPHAKLETLPETGHLPHVESKDQFLRLVLDFLKTEWE